MKTIIVAVHFPSHSKHPKRRDQKISPKRLKKMMKRARQLRKYLDGKGLAHSIPDAL